METRKNSVHEYLQIAEGIMRRYPELKEWTATTNDRKDALGICDYKKKTVELSNYWMKQLPRIETIDTLLHEIAHAIAGYKAKHGKEWKDAARKINARPEATYKGYDFLSGSYGAWMLVNTQTGEIWRMWHDAPPEKWQSGEATNLYPPRNPQMQGMIVFYAFADIPQELLGRLLPLAKPTTTPFLRKFCPANGDTQKRRLYLNGVGELFSGCFLRTTQDGKMEFVIGTGIPDEDDYTALRASLTAALQNINCSLNDDFLKVWQSCNFGAKRPE